MNAAADTGVTPLVPPGAAPRSNINFAARSLPEMTARVRAVTSPTGKTGRGALTCAPASSNRFTVANESGLAAAECSGVTPAIERALGSAPARSNRFTMSSLEMP